MKKTKLYSFIIWILSLALCLGGGAIIGSFMPTPPSEWFQALKKPDFMPPGYLFSIVWPILYFLMGTSLYLFWKAPKSQTEKKLPGYIFFYLQLALNFAWPLIFFLHENILLSLINIYALIIAVIITCLLFAKRSILASILLLPYLGWILFASVLNLSIYFLNA